MTVLGAHNIANRVFGAEIDNSFSDGQQKQIMVTEHGLCRRSQTTNEPKDSERIRAAVDEIADEPQSISGGVKANVLNEALQGIVAPLHIADCVCRHRKGMSTVNGD